MVVKWTAYQSQSGYMKVLEIREAFSNYFQKKNHKKIDSSSLIPVNDPTLLFANAGMNQFKDCFTGKENPLDKRYVTIQKCVRAGGKHNDLENVGETARHHTFFEMLGNFSIGDYFKKEAIEFAWEFLTEELKISKDKLYVTVHEDDDEAFDLWHNSMGVSLDRLFRRGDRDNFWEMGETGPCGPCSEIFYDHGKEHADPDFNLKEAQDFLDDEQRYVEVWNLVFMQYEKSGGEVAKLPKPSIDTGAGLERLAAVLQNKYWNYDTDVFDSILLKIEELTGKKYRDPQYTTSFRIVADHIRSCTMLITDGVIPSNEGRGYVLRRIIRRAVRHLRELDAPMGSFCKLVPTVFEGLGKEYPENQGNMALAEKLLLMEEKKFLETLDLGLKFLKEAVSKDVKNKVLPGTSAFKLYDTYGFPVDLTEAILKEQDIHVDMEGFSQCMEQRKAESRKSWKGGCAIDNECFFKIKEKYGDVEYVDGIVEVVESKLLEIVNLGEGGNALVFEKTPFYGESGGQSGDIGDICLEDKLITKVVDTRIPVENLTVHLIKDASSLMPGETYQLKVDWQHRRYITYNHTATHLLQKSLIDVLGEHVRQSGSSVTAERLRFDFTHTQAVTREELKKVESIINHQISEGIEVSGKRMSRDDALKGGATALFGEKYGNEVRVVDIGTFSKELCGGSHVANTSEIGYFKIISESSLSAGIRRIEALTSTHAINYLRKRSGVLEKIEVIFNDKGERVVPKIKSMQHDLKARMKEIEQLKEKLANLNSQDVFAELENLNEDHVYKAVEVSSDVDLRKLSDNFIDKNPNGVLLIYNSKEDKEKISVLLRVSKNNKKVNCSKILKESLELLKGRGGGRPDMAQGSGERKNVDQFIRKVREMVLGQLG